MHDDKAECGNLATLLQQLGQDLDKYLRFEHPDAMLNASNWRNALGRSLPEDGIGIDNVMAEIGRDLIPNGGPISSPGFTSFITTGATSIGTLANVASAVAAPQRMSLTAFNFLEELSLQWMAEMFELPSNMQGLYSSGGSVANIVALGAARQHTFEQRLGIDPAQEGISHPCRIYTTEASHHTIHRAAAVLGFGRNAITTIASDALGRMSPQALKKQLETDIDTSFIPIAIVATAGTTSTGAIDPLKEIGEIAREHSIWFHIDGAYGLPGILDPKTRPLYEGLSLADSVIVDPHKWLGAPVGIGATFVRDRNILNRAFTQGASDYLEGSMTDNTAQHSMDSLGIPYCDFGVELSAPSRGAVVWALIREIGKTGIRERVCRHNAMAKYVAERARAHPNLEVVQEPTLSICCFRYVSNEWENLNELNTRIHRQLVHNNRNIPSTAVINGTLAIRPCFVGARTSWQQANDLVDEVIATGRQLIEQKT
ncbi:Pyridoxal-dependent decarboxylase [hydrothermal vent metagenome]|uniref:Pyridoxal-dependent decarboxylase n=1 Tax=hydrothermal vent metagenome TaxID=652676 RepID=A0A3B0YT76_9ZZZZ